MAVVDPAKWLVERRARLDRGEAEWLECLAEFDRDSLWALDGQLCCASWLMWAMKMKRSTAFEKLRVAHALARRPVVAKALREGRISYSAARAMTRMVDPDPAVDEALVGLAANQKCPIRDLEMAVRAYMLHADQDRPPREPKPVRDVKIKRGDDGLGKLTVTLSDMELEEAAAALQAYIDLCYRPQPVDESSQADGDEPPAGDAGSGAVEVAAEKAARGDFRFYPQPPDGEAPMDQASRAAQKADAFMNMVNAALAAADGGHAAGDDRYMVHVVTRDQGGSFSFIDGAPVHPLDAAVMTCGCASVVHTVDQDGGPLHLGRKTREWSTAQRRAISVRDGGRCRFPGCGYSHYDIHHMRPWIAGGLTDVDNGICMCRRHHRMIHAGYQMQGDPNHGLAFYRPDHTYLDSTYPAESKTLVSV